MTVTEKYIDFGGLVYHFDRKEKIHRTKENALVHFAVMVAQSWSFARMTDTEKTGCMDALQWASETGALRGTFDARFTILHAVYNAYLAGIGYTGAGWREAVTA